MTTAWNRRLAEYSWISKQVDNVTSGYIKKEVKMKQLRWVRSHDEYKGTNKTAVEYRSLFSRCGAGARVSTCSPKPSTLGSELGTECLETTLPSPSTASQSQVNASHFGRRSPETGNGSGGRASLPSAVWWIIGFGLSVLTKLPFRGNCSAQIYQGWCIRTPSHVSVT